MAWTTGAVKGVDENRENAMAFWRNQPRLKVGRWYRLRPKLMAKNSKSNAYLNYPRKVLCVGEYARYYLMETPSGYKCTIDKQAIGTSVEVRDDGKR